MDKRIEIALNQYAQDVISNESILQHFESLTLSEKRHFLSIFIYYFINQSKPLDTDIDNAIAQSKLKPTYTPCVLLKKGGVASHNLVKIANLPEYELKKVVTLFLSVFRIAYLRRYEVEKGNSGKWWYSDLSDPKNVENILKNWPNVY